MPETTIRDPRSKARPAPVPPARFRGSQMVLLLVIAVLMVGAVIVFGASTPASKPPRR